MGSAKRHGLEKIDLHNGDVEEDAAETHDDGSGSHDSWACEESHGHGKSCNRISTCYDPWLQRHEQTWPPDPPTPTKPKDIPNQSTLILINKERYTQQTELINYKNIK